MPKLLSGEQGEKTDRRAKRAERVLERGRGRRRLRHLLPLSSTRSARLACRFPPPPPPFPTKEPGPRLALSM